MRRLMIAGLASIALAACNGAPAAPPAEPQSSIVAPDIAKTSNPGVDCNVDDADEFIGQTVSETTGKAIQAATGAEIFQWVLEGAAVTDDFRPNRVRVIYDAAGSILNVRCG